MPEQKVTTEQATEALHQMIADHKTATQTETPEPIETAPVEETSTVEEPAAEEAAPETETPEQAAASESPETDDVASLRQRLTEADAARTEQETLHKARWDAMLQRNAENQRILNDRFLRKATVADRALKTLRGVRSEHGLPEADVDRVIQELEGSMNPASQSYAPPPQAAQEDQAVALNQFLNDQQMTATEAQEFGRWVQTEAPSVMPYGEQQVAAESLSGFLRLAHNRWGESKRSKTTQRAQAVEAVKTVQRTQKQAAKAASAAPTAPRKTTVAAPTTDVTKLTQEDVATLLRKSVEMYR